MPEKNPFKKLNSSQNFMRVARVPGNNKAQEVMSERMEQEYLKQAGIKRKADLGLGSSSFSSSNFSRLPLLYVDPLFDPILMMFPKDNLKELNRRLRHYYLYNALVRNIIDLHSEFPLSDFEFKCEDPGIQYDFNHFKETKDLLSMMVMFGKDYWLLGECELPGNRVLMANGVEKAISEIRAGDKVISHKGIIRTVIAPTVRTADETLYGLVVRGEGEDPHWVTGNHPILVARAEEHPCKQGYEYDSCLKNHPCAITAKGNKRKDGTRGVWKYECKQHFSSPKLDFVRADQVRAGDYAVTPQLRNEKEVSEPSFDLARLLGYYVSEGCSTRNIRGKISAITLANKDKAVLEDMKSLFYRVFNKQPKAYYRKKEDCWVIVFNSVEFAPIFKDLCDGLATTKVLSPTVLAWSMDKQLEFLKSFIIGDGTVDDGHATLYTSSMSLSSQLYFMCIRLGMHPSRCITYKKNIALHSKSKVGGTIYQIKLTRNDSIRLWEDAGKLNGIMGGKDQEVSFIKDGYLFKKVKEIKTQHYKGLVYSLEVDVDHTYVSEGIVVHNSFMLGNFDPYNLEWDGFNQYPPEEVEIFNTYITNKYLYYLKPSDDIRKMLGSNKIQDQALSELIHQSNPEFWETMKAGKNFRLPENRLMHISRSPNKYTLRGTSPLLAVVKELLFQDKLRLLQYTFVDRQTSPIKHWKLGSAEKGWIPPLKRFKEFESLLAQATNDADAVLITHPYVEHNWVSPKDMVKDLIPDWEWSDKRIMIGLFVNDAVLHGDLGPYASQAVSMKVLMNKYLTFRAVLENQVTQKLCRPMSIARGYVHRKEADLAHGVRTSADSVVVPKMLWQKLNLTNNTQLQEMMMRLRESSEIPMDYVADLFDWDMEDLNTKMKKEVGTPSDKNYREALAKKVAEDEEIANQILDGKHVAELVIKTEAVKDKETENIEEGIGGGPSISEGRIPTGPSLGGGGGGTAIPPEPEPLPGAPEERVPVGENETPETPAVPSTPGAEGGEGI